MSSLGSRLKEARKEAGYSLMDVENTIGVSNGYISQLENNKKKNPSMKLLKQLAKLYEVQLSDLVAPKETLVMLTEEDRDFFEKSLNEEQKEQIATLLREARGLTPGDLARIIQIAKSWNKGEIPED